MDCAKRASEFYGVKKWALILIFLYMGMFISKSFFLRVKKTKK